MINPAELRISYQLEKDITVNTGGKDIDVL